MKLDIIAYHHVTRINSDVDSRLYIDIEKFEKQIKYIKSLNINILNRIGSVIKYDHAIMFTFDDGYENFYKLAYPILLKHRMPVVLFVSTAKIGKYLFEKDYGYKQRYVTKNQILEMLGSGLVNVQPHGDLHLNFTLLGKKNTTREIANSIAKLMEEFNLVSEFFCLPYGAYDNKTLEILKKFNTLKYIFTTNSSSNTISTSTNSNCLQLLNRYAFKSSIELSDFSKVIKS